MTPQRVAYGPDASQWIDVHRPDRPSRGTVLVIHGGFWKAAYDASLGEPLARDLARRGWAAVNMEYRRVGTGPGGGGGCPATLDDVAAAVDSLPADLDRSLVVTLGHSAGGHLAAWAASRGSLGWPASVRVTHVVSQAGVLHLADARAAGLGSGAVDAFVGDFDPALVDPWASAPLEVPVWCVHAPDDEDVPFHQSSDYVERVTSAGGSARLVEVTGGHFGLIDVGHAAWATQLAILDGLG